MGITDSLRARLFAYRSFWWVLLFVFCLDQLTKFAIVEWSGFAQGLYPPFDGWVVVPGYLNIVYAVNYGAAWGMLSGLSWLLIGLAFVVLGFIWIFRKSLELQRIRMQLCFGLMCGGIIGNTMDRLFRGHVVDFIDVHLQVYRWPTFNVADSGIVLGTILYILMQFRSTNA